MKKRRWKKMTALSLLFIFFSSNHIPAEPLPQDNPDETQEENEIEIEEPKNLYALSACLMDADSGRILFGKEEDVRRANASTTKIMTLIVTLEHADLNNVVTFSDYAASQPDVQLNGASGEQFLLKDLCFSLMLESHNDSAVIIAENSACYYIYQVQSGIYPDTYDVLSGKDLSFVSFSSGFDTSFLQNITTEQSKILVAVFTGLMNEKAVSLGCTQTHFITPNGLDASDETGEHATTAKELAVIMSYCIQNEEFLAITQAKEHQFDSYSVSNANAFLNMYDGVLSGKTGFTGNAGYCYVCACRYDGKTFIAALLACGWPPSKTYKWHHCRTLLNCGLEHFNHEEIIGKNFPLKSITVTDGLEKELPVSIHDTCRLLLRKEDLVNVVINTPDSIAAPVFTGDIVGSVCVYVNDALLFSTPVYADACIRRTDYLYFLNQVIKSFCFIDK